MSNEVMWKTLIYNGEIYDKFEVSNDGNIRNVQTGTVYKTHLNHEGYCQVCVSLGSRNKKKIFKVHRAVAETFIDNPNNKEQVNHIDCNKTNNAMSNLEWVTCLENMKHASERGLLHAMRGVDNCNSKLTENDVIYIREHYILGDKTYGSRALGRKFNVSHTTILDVINDISYVNV